MFYKILKFYLQTVIGSIYDVESDYRNKLNIKVKVFFFKSRF